MFKLLKGLLVVLLAVFLMTTLACKKKDTDDIMNIEGEGKGETAVPVKVVKVTRGDISSYIETTSTLEAEKEVDILSQTTGLVVDLKVEEGDYVKKNQVLLRIDDREAKAAFEASKATYEEREQQWARAQETYEKKITSKESFEQARYNYAKAEADLQTAKLRLLYTEVKAPFEGIITERLIHPGSMLSVNQKLFKIVDSTPLLARIYLPERELSKVKKGQPAELKLEAYPGKTFEAFIKMINPVVDPDSGTFKVTLEMKSDENLLRPGMFASVYLVTETHSNALLVPKQALLLEAEKDTIFVVDGKFAYAEEIKVGFRDDKNIEILDSKIKVDSYIVVVGQDGINSGTEVKMYDLQGKEIKVEEKQEEEFNLEDLE
ncbi:MAG: efflux RND transporter periplasmic adaptor subunit [Acidobacteria bacterium]|nr:efflux RND transporter periplasmic adaptor subunit [Acidobacteriota bacterium]